MENHNDPLCRREFLKRTTLATAAISAGLGAAAAPLLAHAGATGTPRAPRISYYKNGEIHVKALGESDGKPLTTGHVDFKPSWSKTGDMLICFRRLKDDPLPVNWKNAVFVIDVDGSGFHLLSDGSRCDANPTWTREGRNTPIWNRKNDRTGSFYVVQSKVGNKPGQEVPLTDESFFSWAHSCLVDGRILVTAVHPKLGWGPFLLTRRKDGKPLYERIQCELTRTGQFHRVSVSPSEKKICCEYLAGAKFREPGHTLYIADFDVQQRTITNLKPIANEEGKPIWFAYPRWIDGESAVIYHSSESGKNQLYVYRLEDGSTKRVSTDPAADYRYPHGEAAPC